MEADEYTPNDTLHMDFEVVPGTWLTMDIQFDFLPHGISWAVESNDMDLTVMEGGDYINDVYASEFISLGGCAVNGCYTLTVEDLFGNGVHYSPPGWYELTDSEGNVLGTGSGNFGAEQTHEFCVEGSSVEPCEDLNGNGVCDAEEDDLYVAVPGCTDPASCTYDAAANADDGSCEYLDALGECGGDCEADVDGDGVCDSAEILGCTDPTACNYDEAATEDNGGCEVFDALGECGGDCVADVDGDGICDTDEILGCTDEAACNYEAGATDDDGGCEYAEEGLDCDGNPLVVITGCTDEEACNYDAAANTDDGGCEYAMEGYDCEGNPLTSSVSDLQSTPTITAFPNPSSGRFAIRGLQEKGRMTSWSSTCTVASSERNASWRLLKRMVGWRNRIGCCHPAPTSSGSGTTPRLQTRRSASSSTDIRASIGLPFLTVVDTTASRSGGRLDERLPEPLLPGEKKANGGSARTGVRRSLRCAPRSPGPCGVPPNVPAAPTSNGARHPPR